MSTVIPDLELSKFAKYIESNPSNINKVTSMNFLSQFLCKHEQFKEHLSDQKVVELNAFLNPYTTIDLPENKDTFLLYGFTNYTNEIFARLHMLGMIGFMYQALDEHGLGSNDFNIKEVSPEMEAEKVVIKGFLDKMFTFNPNVHVRDCYSAFKDKEMNNPDRKYLLTNSTLKVLEAYPSADLFANYDSYFSMYYNEFYGLSNKLWGLNSELEIAINPYTVGTKDEINEFKNKYGGDIRVKTSMIKMGNWTMVAPWRQNSKNTTFALNADQTGQINVNDMMKVPDYEKLRGEIIKKKTDRIKKERPLTDDDKRAIRTYYDNMGISDVINEALEPSNQLEPEEGQLQYNVKIIDGKTGNVTEGNLNFSNLVK